MDGRGIGYFSGIYDYAFREFLSLGVWTSEPSTSGPHVTAIEDNPSSKGNDDPHDEVIRLEELAAEIESCSGNLRAMRVKSTKSRAAW